MQCELMYYAILFIMKSLNKLIQDSNNINLQVKFSYFYQTAHTICKQLLNFSEGT